jgi:hypothetical protein
MYLRYSSSVVAPIMCSSPRASSGLSKLPASIEPSVLPAPTTVCSSSTKSSTRPFGALHFFEHGFEALFEFAAIFRAGDQRAHVERDDLLIFETLGHVAAHDALRESLDDRRLADAGFADEHRVVFRAAREHLHHAPDLVVAADDRIEFALLGRAGEVLP